MCGLRKLRLERSIFNFGCDSPSEEFEFTGEGDWSAFVCKASTLCKASLFGESTCKLVSELYSESIYGLTIRLSFSEHFFGLKFAIDLL